MSDTLSRMQQSGYEPSLEDFEKAKHLLSVYVGDVSDENVVRFLYTLKQEAINLNTTSPDALKALYDQISNKNN